MTPERRRLTAAACAGMFLFGLATSLVGALLPVLAERHRFNLAQSGELFLLLNLGVLVCVFALGPAIDRRGTKAPIVIGCLLAGSALVMTMAAGSFAVLAAAAFLLGLGAGCLNAGTNTLTASLHDDAGRRNAAFNFLGVFFGLGGLLMPLTAGLLPSRAGLEVLLAIPLAACLAAAAWIRGILFPETRHATRTRAIPTRALLRQPYVVTTAVLLFFQAGNEVMLAGFTTTYLTRDLGADMGAASNALSLLWAAMLASRLALARLSLRIEGEWIVLAGAALAALGSASLLTAPALGTAMASLVVTGIGISGVFPTTLGLAGACYRDQSGRLMGVLLTVSRVGSMIIPFAGGAIAERFGLRAALALVPVGALGVLVLQLFSRGLRDRIEDRT